ncbi:MAG: HIT domain-containing protein [Fibrobacteria bacterium]|nr:HIT domain-containing protein [Fibrobacteria bacterium]
MSEPTLFEKIHQGTIPARFLLREELCFAIEDIDPKAPFHALVIPVKPIPSLAEATDDDAPILAACLACARRLAKEKGLTQGWRLVANTGMHANQTVPHLHFHLLGGRRMGWPPG